MKNLYGSHENKSCEGRSVSLIVATVGRPFEIKRLLDSLCMDSDIGKEVIIINQAPEDVRQKVRSVVESYGNFLNIKYIVDDGCGLSRARNIGLAHATKDIVAFPDDDCWYSATLLSSVFRKFEANDSLGVVVGPYSEPGIFNPAFPKNFLSLSVHNFIGKTSSVGLFFKRSRLRGVAFSFDEAIGAGAKMPVGEETDLMMRLLMNGVVAVYDPSVLVYHKIERKKILSTEVAASHRQAFWYVIGKNYCFGYSELRLIKGVLLILFRFSNVLSNLRAAIIGYKMGRNHGG